MVERAEPEYTTQIINIIETEKAKLMCLKVHFETTSVAKFWRECTGPFEKEGLQDGASAESGVRDACSPLSSELVLSCAPRPTYLLPLQNALSPISRLHRTD